MPQLVVRQLGHPAFSVPLRDGFEVGRHVQNDLVLYDHQVSRQHVRFSVKDGRWWAEDRESTHGTLFNGDNKSAAEIHDGDVLQVGNVLLQYFEGDDAREVVFDTRVDARPPQIDGSDRRLRLLYEASGAIRSLGDLDALLARMVRSAVEVLGGERGVIGQLEGGSIRHLAAHTIEQRSGELIVSRSLVQAVVGQREAVIVHDQSERNRTMLREGILSAMCVPLVAGARVVGFIYVDDRGEAGRFTAEDLAYLNALGFLTAAAIEAAEQYRQAVDAVALTGASPAGEIVGASPAMQALAAELRKFAAAGDANVLIEGETGVGKELVARHVHRSSPRAAYPFEAVNCAAIPETMIESELFGYEKGAFTGAVRDRRGRFALAHRGTLFLDEIGDLSPSAQAKVLRALQEGEVQPLGSERSMRVDVRVIAATHKDLHAEIAAGRFRDDLYYRLAVLEVSVPPLRAREGDVELLAHSFVARAADRLGKRVDGFARDAIAALARYPWPGNVRELQNECERATILGEAPLIGLADLSPRVRAASNAPPQSPPLTADKTTLAERFAELEAIERHLVQCALEKARGNVSEAARLLGISRIMMRRRVERFQLQAEDD